MLCPLPICHWRRSVSLFVLVFTFSVLSPAQEEPTFRTQSNVVLVPVLVRDKSGSIVYGLKPDDFIIEDHGVPQTLYVDESAESEPISLVVAVLVGRRADLNCRACGDSAQCWTQCSSSREAKSPCLPSTAKCICSKLSLVMTPRLRTS